MTLVEILVPMDCSGCETKIRKALKKLKGVDDIDVDLNMQKVTVMGWADQKKVLKAVRKTGKRAEIWPYPYNPQFQNINNLQYYQQHRPEDHRHHGGSHHHQRHSTQVVPVITYNSIPHSSRGGGGGSSAYSYNYYKHGSTNQDHGYYQPSPYSGVFNEHDTHVFSDDNPNACSIM